MSRAGTNKINLKKLLSQQKHAIRILTNKRHFEHAKELFNSQKMLGDSRNYMPAILVPSSAKRIVTQILVIAKLNTRKDFIWRVFLCDIICLSKELPVQS